MPDPLPLDHVAIAVESIAEALPRFQCLSGASAGAPERVESQGVRVVFLGTGAGRLELIEPLSADSGVARFLRKHGPGLHHIAYRVGNLADELRRLEAEGVELIDREPRAGAHGHRVAFIHPRGAAGVLVELVEG